MIYTSSVRPQTRLVAEGRTHFAGGRLECTHCSLWGVQPVRAAIELANCVGGGGAVDNIAGQLRCAPAASVFVLLY